MAGPIHPPGEKMKFLAILCLASALPTFADTIVESNVDTSALKRWTRKSTANERKRTAKETCSDLNAVDPIEEHELLKFNRRADEAFQTYGKEDARIVRARDGHKIIVVSKAELKFDVQSVVCPPGLLLAEVMPGAPFGQVPGDSIEYSVRCVGRDFFAYGPNAGFARFEPSCPDGFKSSDVLFNRSSFGQRTPAYDGRVVMEYSVQCVAN